MRALTVMRCIMTDKNFQNDQIDSNEHAWLHQYVLNIRWIDHTQTDDFKDH